MLMLMMREGEEGERGERARAIYIGCQARSFYNHLLPSASLISDGVLSDGRRDSVEVDNLLRIQYRIAGGDVYIDS